MRKYRIALMLMIGLGLFTSACGPKDSLSHADPELPDSENHIENSTAAVYRKITAQEAHQMMTELEDYILLDVRTEEEFQESRIDGAILIPSDEISSRAQKELTDPDAVIFVYCRSGRRSVGAAKTLVELGYTNIYDFGGITDWGHGTVSN